MHEDEAQDDERNIQLGEVAPSVRALACFLTARCRHQAEGVVFLGTRAVACSLQWQLSSTKPSPPTPRP
jgi:hypothetical protein